MILSGHSAQEDTTPFNSSAETTLDTSSQGGIASSDSPVLVDNEAHLPRGHATPEGELAAASPLFARDCVMPGSERGQEIARQTEERAEAVQQDIRRGRLLPSAPPLLKRDLCQGAIAEDKASPPQGRSTSQAEAKLREDHAKESGKHQRSRITAPPQESCRPSLKGRKQDDSDDDDDKDWIPERQRKHSILKTAVRTWTRNEQDGSYQSTRNASSKGTASTTIILDQAVKEAARSFVRGAQRLAASQDHSLQNTDLVA
jgi:hypothetical protein